MRVSTKRVAMKTVAHVHYQVFRGCPGVLGKCEVLHFNMSNDVVPLRFLKTLNRAAKVETDEHAIAVHTVMAEYCVTHATGTQKAFIQLVSWHKGQ